MRVLVRHEDWIMIMCQETRAKKQEQEPRTKKQETNNPTFQQSNFTSTGNPENP